MGMPLNHPINKDFRVTIGGGGKTNGSRKTDGKPRWKGGIKNAKSEMR
jgi:hypothetical protein